ncbi:MAG: GspH/FimT family pseudopilin [Burkholderiaceae bacterium]
MRQLTAPRGTAQRGFTLIEVMVAIAIAALLVVQGLPAYANYMANSRLREGANVVVAGLVFARSEAIKRNHPVRVTIAAQRLVAAQIDGTVTTVLRSFELPATLQAPAFAANFDSTGRPAPFGTDVTLALSSADRPCSADLRCPSIHIEAGGAVSLCRSGAC